MSLPPTTRVWRYMSFGKFVWMLQHKQLWLTNAELLDDKWELMPLGQQLNYSINNRPPSLSAKAATESVATTVKALRKNTFVNCWTASEHESHALWRIYCPSAEGVAIQTTLGRLKQSAGVPVMEVSYSPHEAEAVVLDPLKLVTQKRPMFAYEHEVRIVLKHDYADSAHPERKTVGVGLAWDPEVNLEMVRVHPEAHFLFMETVTEVVRRLAPNLAKNGTPLVAWSEMSSGLPF